MSIGVVVIGRNEGERLRRCLESVVGRDRRVVYVDSGSTDESVSSARKLGAEVVTLDPVAPFTAARARNAGWQHLVTIDPGALYVQFVDGDCEVHPGWIAAAARYLSDNVNCVVVCGRQRERHPGASVFNRLCDMEWDTPIGVADACGGDAMMRLAALRAVDGYRDGMIAGEEPELCLRLRRAGGTIVRLDREMTLHDAAMTGIGQWWKRAVRAGHAYAQGATLSQDEPQGLWRREAASTWFWGLVLPLLALAFVYPTNGWSLLLFGAYALLGIRILLWAARRWSFGDAVLFARFGVLAKFAHLAGMVRFHLNRLTHRQSRLIEYKAVPVASGPP